MDFHCGHSDEWDFIAKNYARAIDNMTNSHDTCLTMLTGVAPQGQEQNTLYLLAASCLKEFEEICLLAGNGYGTGATKLLRAFYERVTTLSYLALKPNKVQQFIDYTTIHWHKLLAETESVHEGVNLTEDQIRTIRQNFESSKEQFMEDVCKPCGKRRVQMGWTKASVLEQASQVNKLLRLLAFNIYLRPTFYLHTTFFGITQQVERTAEGKFKLFGTTIQRQHAREALDFAHLLLVQTVDVINDYFKLGQDEKVRAVGEGWKNAWAEPSLQGDVPK